MALHPSVHAAAVADYVACSQHADAAVVAVFRRYAPCMCLCVCLCVCGFLHVLQEQPSCCTCISESMTIFDVLSLFTGSCLSSPPCHHTSAWPPYTHDHIRARSKCCCCCCSTTPRCCCTCPCKVVCPDNAHPPESLLASFRFDQSTATIVPSFSDQQHGSGMPTFSPFSCCHCCLLI